MEGSARLTLGNAVFSLAMNCCKACNLCSSWLTAVCDAEKRSEVLQSSANNT